MGIERNLKDGKGGELCEVFDETNTNDMKSRRNRRHRQWMKMSPVQKLFLACQHVFANASPGIVPSSQHIELLSSILGTNLSLFFFKIYYFTLLLFIFNLVFQLFFSFQVENFGSGMKF